MVTKKAEVMKKCEEMIKNFNPITHSIDTHVQDQLAGKSKFDEIEKGFIQQVLYGWYRHKPALEGFADNFFADNAAFVSRADKTMYIIFAYLALFRLEDLGFSYFKQFTSTEDPTKIFNLVSYLFNKDNLWSCLRAEWMKYYDLSFVEDELIAGIESFIPDCQSYLFELQEKAQGLAAAQAAKEQALKNGTAGLGEVMKKKSTTPVSPKITRPRPPRLPEAIEIPLQIQANEIPPNLNDITLDKLNEMNQQRLEEIRKETLGQYSDKYHFQLKSGASEEGKSYHKSLDELRREVEEERNKDLLFDSAFVNPIPDYDQANGKVRLNAAAILREDSLYRKQQAKDVNLLKQYEWELRDSSEYYSWQQQMKEHDHKEKLLSVNLRREQAKLSSIEAKEAMNKQREDNQTIGNLLREQANEIKLQKQLESEIILLTNQQQAAEIIEIRSIKPKEAKEKVVEQNQQKREIVNQELTELMKEKALNDTLEEAIRIDKIRQLKALNSIHKEAVKVFDPTETAGTGVMDEMSYMEMKERLVMERNKQQQQKEMKQTEILENKEKKANYLQEKSEGILKMRELKANSSRQMAQKRKEQKEKELQEQEFIRIQASIKLETELKLKRTEKTLEQTKLKEEADRIIRQQQYLGASMGRIEETRAEQLQLGEERELKSLQNKIKTEVTLQNKSKQSDLENQRLFNTQKKKEKRSILLEQDIDSIREKKIAIEKLKEEYQRKKAMVGEGHVQQKRTKEVQIEKNVYGHRITQESIERSRLLANKTNRAKTS